MQASYNLEVLVVLQRKVDMQNKVLALDTDFETKMLLFIKLLRSQYQMIQVWAGAHNQDFLNIVKELENIEDIEQQIENTTTEKQT